MAHSQTNHLPFDLRLSWWSFGALSCLPLNDSPAHTLMFKRPFIAVHFIHEEHIIRDSNACSDTCEDTYTDVSWRAESKSAEPLQRSIQQ